MWRCSGIWENSRQKSGLRKLLIVVLWLILSAGIYWCSGLVQGTKESEELADSGNTKNEEIASDSEEHTYSDKEEMSRKEALSDDIRVLIKNDNYSGIYHNQVSVICSNGFVAECGDEIREYAAGYTFVITK